jgi:TonB-linked SusC/RagA family outer membrane protein
MKKILTILLCCVSVAVSAQVRTIQGTVTSGADGSPVGGVVVTIQGSNTSAITDAQGSYSIKASTGAVLAFQMLGFDRAEIAVGAANVLDVVLTPQVTEIEELVVIGYGTQQKKLITGATVQVDGESIAKLNTVNVMGALQSQTPGLNIIQNNGAPGQGYKINIRGLGTIGNSTPLFVIDGAPGGDINNYNPADIESIDVLKDAASAAIYGSRAANGVILVTTKHGKAGQKAQVSFDAYYGVQNVYRMPQLLNAEEYMAIINEGYVMDGKAPFDFASKAYNSDEASKYFDANGKWIGGEGTDWMEQIRNENAPIQNYAVNITGGTSEGTYALGFSYTNQEGALGKPVAPRYERYTARINSQYTIVKGRNFDILKVGENLTYNHTLTPGAMRTGGTMYWNDIMGMMQRNPLLPMYDDEGNYHYAIPYNGREANPVALMEYNQETISRNHGLRTNVYLDFQPIKNLVFRSNFGYNVSTWAYRSFAPTFDLSSDNKSLNETISQSMGVSAGMSWENTLNYTFKIGDDHNFTALLGQAIEKSGGKMGEQLAANSSNPQFSGLKYAYLDNAPYSDALPSKGFSGSPMGEGQLASFFGRVSYDYQNKYMMTVVLRADGSSNFARGHRWGYFPSVSAGWVVTEEDFMENTKSWMDFLKVRASWGQNGNASISNFQYLSPVVSGARYVFGTQKNDAALGYYPSILANTDVSWETSEQIDLGIDASFFRNRLSVTADYFIKNTKDWLVVAPMLASYGTGAPYVNGGSVRNSGVELAFAWNDRKGDFTYGANLNLTFIKNKVTEIGNSEKIIHGAANFMWQGQDESYRAEVGMPIGYFYGYETAGIFQSQAQIDSYTGAKLDGTKPGDVIWVDKNGDGVINTDDRGYLGKPNPDVRLGFGLNLGYKGFDLSMTVIGTFGNNIAKSFRSWGDGPLQNYTSDIFDRWHGEGTSNRTPRVSTAPHTNTNWFSDLYIEKGDFVRIQNLTLGYNLNEVIKSGFLTQARVYVTAQNLLTITGYSGMDPEIGSGADAAQGWTSGIDVGYYPNPRTYLVGINLKF